MAESENELVALKLSNGLEVRVAPEMEAKKVESEQWLRTRVGDDSKETPTTAPSGVAEAEAEKGPLHQRSYSVHKVSKPDLSGWTGGSVWESGQVIARLLSAEPQRVQGKRVVELGTGCGLVSLTAGALGARQVTMTDQVLFMGNHNLEANFGGSPELRRRFRMRPLKWGDPELIAATEPPFDLILGSDIMYHSSHHDVLAETIVGLSSVGTRVLWATPDWELQRKESAKGFRERLEQAGFEMRELTEEPGVKAIIEAVQGDMDGAGWFPYGGRGPVKVYEMQRGAAPTQSRL